MEAEQICKTHLHTNLQDTLAHHACTYTQLAWKQRESAALTMQLEQSFKQQCALLQQRIVQSLQQLKQQQKQCNFLFVRPSGLITASEPGP